MEYYFRSFIWLQIEYSFNNPSDNSVFLIYSERTSKTKETLSVHNIAQTKQHILDGITVYVFFAHPYLDLGSQILIHTHMAHGFYIVESQTHLAHIIWSKF